MEKTLKLNNTFQKLFVCKCIWDFNILETWRKMLSLKWQFVTIIWVNWIFFLNNTDHTDLADYKAVTIEVLAEHAVKHGYMLIVAFERGDYQREVREKWRAWRGLEAKRSPVLAWVPCRRYEPCSSRTSRRPRVWQREQWSPCEEKNKSPLRGCLTGCANPASWLRPG